MTIIIICFIEHYSLASIKLTAIYRQLKTKTITKQFKQAESFPLSIFQSHSHEPLTVTQADKISYTYEQTIKHSKTIQSLKINLHNLNGLENAMLTLLAMALRSPLLEKWHKV